MGYIHKCANRVNKIVEVLSTVILGVAVLITLLQIFVRIVFGRGGALPWVWESVIVLNVWLTYLGSSVLSKENKHIALNPLSDRLPLRLSRVLFFLRELVVVVTSCLVIVVGVRLSLRQLQSPFVTIPFLRRGHASSVVTIGFTLILFYKLLDLVRALDKSSTEDPGCVN